MCRFLSLLPLLRPYDKRVFFYLLLNFSKKFWARTSSSISLEKANLIWKLLGVSEILLHCWVFCKSSGNKKLFLSGWFIIIGICVLGNPISIFLAITCFKSFYCADIFFKPCVSTIQTFFPIYLHKSRDREYPHIIKFISQSAAPNACVERSAATRATSAPSRLHATDAAGALQPQQEIFHRFCAGARVYRYVRACKTCAQVTSFTYLWHKTHQLGHLYNRGGGQE